MVIIAVKNNRWKEKWKKAEARLVNPEEEEERNEGWRKALRTIKTNVWQVNISVERDYYLTQGQYRELSPEL